MKTRAFSRAERELMVIAAFAVHIGNGNENKLTMYKIAGKLGMKPSAHLTRILNRMVAEGKLDTFTRPNKGRWTTWFYALPEGSYLPPKKRTIRLNNRGALVGQLELF